MAKLRKILFHVTGEWFNEAKEGRKPWEHRLNTPVWRKRLVGREYDIIEYCLGYPKKGDMSRRLFFKWAGVKEQRLQHKHFGPDVEHVISTDISNPISWQEVERMESNA